MVTRDMMMESSVQFIDPHSVKAGQVTDTDTNTGVVPVCWANISLLTITFCEASGDCYGAVQLSGPTHGGSQCYSNIKSIL